MTPAQSRAHFALLSKLGITTDADRYRTYSILARRPIASSTELTAPEVDHLLKSLDAIAHTYGPADREMQVAIFKTQPVDPWAEVSAA